MPKPGFRLELITADDESLDLHVPPNKVVWNMSGWGLSPREFTTIRGPFQQGDSVISQQLQPRVVTLTLRHNGRCSDAHWSHRGTYIEYLRENRSALYDPEPIQLIMHYYDNGTYKKRALDVFFDSGFAFTPADIGAADNFAIQEELQFTAHDPLVYDPTAATNAVSSLTGQLILPVTFPFVLGSYQATNTITNAGTWETYPTITVAGPAQNFTIENVSTNKRINFAGEVVGGNNVIFDLRYSIKTVTDGCGTDLMQYVTGDLGTFSLQCDPLVTGGANSIKVVSETFNPGSTVFTFSYYTRYRGI